MKIYSKLPTTELQTKVKKIKNNFKILMDLGSLNDIVNLRPNDGKL